MSMYVCINVLMQLMYFQHILGSINITVMVIYYGYGYYGSNCKELSPRWRSNTSKRVIPQNTSV